MSQNLTFQFSILDWHISCGQMLTFKFFNLNWYVISTAVVLSKGPRIVDLGGMSIVHKLLESASTGTFFMSKSASHHSRSRM